MDGTFVVGITGGIASGKSMMTNILRAKGATVIDADAVSREVMARPDLTAEIARAFPDAVEQGCIDRAALRRAAFSDENRLKALNAITHPAIYREIERRIGELQVPLVFIVVPLLFEAGYGELCDYIVTIVASEALRIKRVLQRDTTMDEALAVRIIRAQISENERITGANQVIVNNDSPERFKKRAEEFYKHMVKMSGHK